MKVYISIVSHGHKEIIEEIGCLPSLANDTAVELILLDNIGEKGLRPYCQKNGITYLENKSKKGFGENNNIVFRYVEDNVGFQDDDYFLILNPDVKTDSMTILNTCSLAEANSSQLSTINLFKDMETKAFDNCVRYFPSFFDFLSSYLGLGNQTIIDKSKISKPMTVDWAAGSFLLFKVDLYKNLGGFDPAYFMYCEDIDICWRAQKLASERLMFFPDVKATHYAKHANRSLLSKHFFWHLKSVFRYLTMYYGLRKPYRTLENNNA